MIARRRTLVLCYHAVTPRWQHALALPAERLLAQLRFLIRRGLKPVGADAAAAGVPRSFHVTFDDAFRSAGRVLPAVEELGIRATIFACPGYADRAAPIDVPELAATAAAQPEELATMGWEALASAAERGHEVGSHTVTHPHLTSLGDAELAAELADAKARIEATLGRPCRYLAYPYGDEDGRVRAAAETAGYAAAFGLPGRGGPFSVPRLGVYLGDGTLRFRAKALLRSGRR